MQPLVTTIIPVYNGAKFVAGAIESALAQTHKNQEIIVVDDGSTDETPEVVARFTSVRYFRQPQRARQGPARNRGVRAAKGTVLAFLDADDRWHPNKIYRQLDHLEQNPEFDFVLCRMTALLLSGQTWPRHIHRPHYATQPVAYLPSALLVRAASFARVGEFSPLIAEDLEWFLSARTMGLRHGVVDEVLVTKGVRPDSCLSAVNNHQRGAMRHIRKMLAERRKSPRAGAQNG